jgi:hypothetical protein
MPQLNAMERLPLGCTTSKDSMSVHCSLKVLVSNCSKETTITGRELATVTISIFGSCDDLPCHHRRHAKSYSTGALAFGT